MPRLSWDQYGASLARTVALRSDCKRSQVGAVLLDAGNRVVATGYNGAPAGQAGCESCPRGQHWLHTFSSMEGPVCGNRKCPGFIDVRKCPGVQPGSSYENCVAIHAEANCLLYAGRDRALGGTLYITREPCHECARLITAAGVARVVVGE